jgi:hypothetical protein
MKFEVLSYPEGSEFPEQSAPRDMRQCLLAGRNCAHYGQFVSADPVASGDYGRDVFIRGPVFVMAASGELIPDAAYRQSAQDLPSIPFAPE